MNRKGIAPIAIFLLLAALAGAGYYAYDKFAVQSVLPDNYERVLIGAVNQGSNFNCPTVLNGKNVIRCELDGMYLGTATTLITVNPGSSGYESYGGYDSYVLYGIVLKQSICGNGILETGEECDSVGQKIACTVDGKSGFKTCVSSCSWSACEVEACTPGEKSCQGNDVVTCDSTGMNWISPTPCSTSCINGKCTICSPGSTQTQGCGNCGQQAKTCGADGQWGIWGVCNNQGCSPTTTQTCAVNNVPGRQTCSSSCQWGLCEKTGICVPGTKISCGTCGEKTCDMTGNYGDCQPKSDICGSGYTCS